MPLPSDEKLIALSNDLLQQFETIFGAHAGFRPAHAKGRLLTGRFTPTPSAAALCRAPHFQSETPVTVRFSNATGIPMIPDGDPNASPRGMAVRFHLGERVHTDIVAHSTDGFPTHTGEEFLEFLQAVAASGAPDGAKSSPSPIEVFLGGHPAALAFVQKPKPVPSSFARETYFGVTSAHFFDAVGNSRYGRYRIVPDDGNDFLADAGGMTPNFLFEEIVARVATGPVAFKIYVQLSEPGDAVNDATIHWPEDRTLLNLGALVLTGLVADDAQEQQRMIFDPIPRVDGIEHSDDPLLELRAAVYLMSGRKRRAAGAVG